MAENKSTKLAGDDGGLLAHPEIQRMLSVNPKAERAVGEILKMDIDRDLKAALVTSVMMGG